MNRKRLAVISGGDSPEAVISRKSAKQVFNSIDRELFDPYIVDMVGTCWQTAKGEPIDKNDFSFTDTQGNRIIFEYALIMIHGTPGEDGKLQGYFDLMRIPYSTCNAEVSVLTFNKMLCKQLISNIAEINLAREIVLYRDSPIEPEKYAQELGLPFFIKPNASGSSFGVTKVRESEQILPAIELARKEGTVVLMEEFIDGVEVSQGVMVVGGRELVLPVTELSTENDFFDFEAKYSVGVTNEITPARIPDSVTKLLNRITLDIYKTLGCRGIVRVDYIIRDNKPYFIEVNTVPGMSANSIVPQQWEYIGLSMRDAFTMIITDKAEL